MRFSYVLKSNAGKYLVSKVIIKFLKTFLKRKSTEYWVLFIWRIAFETLVICEVESVLWEETLLYDFRQVCQLHYTQIILTLSFKAHLLLPSMLYSPMFSGYKRKPSLVKCWFQWFSKLYFKLFPVIIFDIILCSFYLF